MPTRCAAPADPATRTSGGNSRRDETIRRFLQARVPRGADAEIALESDRAVNRVYLELEGRGAALSIGVGFAAARHVSLEDRLRFASFLLEPLGLQPIPLSVTPIPEP